MSIFEYASAAAADRDRAMISPDGASVSGAGCTASISWIGPPHFYKRDRRMAVYAGTAEEVLRPLEAVLGNPSRADSTVSYYGPVLAVR